MGEFKTKFENGGAGTSPLSSIAGGGGSVVTGWTNLPPPTNLAFIEPHEEAEAKALIDKQFVEMCGKAFSGRATRFFCVVKIHMRPEEIMTTTDKVTGETKTLYLPDTIRAEDKYQSCVGLVIALGPDCFKNKDGTERGSRYCVGSYVIFPRTDIIRIDYRGVALGVMTDDRVIMVVDEPSDWTQGIVQYKA